MDNAIFEMQFLRAILLAPTTGTDNAVDWESMDIDLRGTDRFMFQEKRHSMPDMKKPRLVCMCGVHVKMALFPRHQQLYRNITDEQFAILLEIGTCYLLQYKSFKDDVGISQTLLDLLAILNVFLLGSNKKQECVIWIRKHFSELKSVRSAYGNTILHECIDKIEWMLLNKIDLPVEPFVRLLVEKGKMDVNDVNTEKRRATPLHLLSTRVSYMELDERGFYPKMPTEDTMKIAEILIDNGAHMDQTDWLGREASRYFSERFPQWAFNVSLQCLAAKALFKHGIRYEKRAPKTLIPFIESHKPKDS